MENIEVPSVPAKTATRKASELAEGQTVYSCDIYEGMGLRFCEICLEKFRTGLHGEPICPINKPGCARQSTA